MGKGVLVDTRETGWHRNCLKAAAMAEDMTRDMSEAGREGDPGKLDAMGECMLSQVGKGRRKRNGLEAATIGEGVVTNAGGALWNRDVRQAFTSEKGVLTDAQDSFRNGDVREIVAIGKGVAPNSGGGSRDRVGAIVTVRRGCGNQLLIGVEKDVQIGTEVGTGRVDVTNVEAGAADEGLAPITGEACRNGNAGQIRAACTGTIRNSGDRETFDRGRDTHVSLHLGIQPGDRDFTIRNRVSEEPCRHRDITLHSAISPGILGRTVSPLKKVVAGSRHRRDRGSVLIVVGDLISIPADNAASTCTVAESKPDRGLNRKVVGVFIAVAVGNRDRGIADATGGGGKGDLEGRG